METREFKRADWDSFAGAEGWGDLEPLTGEGTFDGREFCVVFDKDGVFATDGTSDLSLVISFPTPGAAAVFAAGFPKTATLAELEKMGFAEV